MSFVYPRTISISRPTQPAGIGAVGYGGELQSIETIIISGVPASIQQKKEGRTNAVDLPGDSRASMWQILFFGALGIVQDRDVITDDLGIRYQVQGAYWNSLGYNCTCEILET